MSDWYTCETQKDAEACLKVFNDNVKIDKWMPCVVKCTDGKYRVKVPSSAMFTKLSIDLAAQEKIKVDNKTTEQKIDTFHFPDETEPLRLYIVGGYK